MHIPYCSFAIAGPTAWNSLPTTSRTSHRWRPLNPSSKLIFLNSRITAIKCTAPFPSASAVLRCYINCLIIIVTTDWTTYDQQLTESFDGVVSLFRVEDLPIDIRNAYTIAENVTTDEDILVDGRSPTDDDWVGLWTDTERGRSGGNGWLWNNEQSTQCCLATIRLQLYG